MELDELLRRRRMVRRYTHEPVSPEAVRRIIERARRGPSAGYAQGQHFVVVTDETIRGGIAALCREDEFVASGHQPWLSVAPVHVLLCVRPQDYRDRYGEPDKVDSRGPDGWDVPYWFVDGGAALMLLLLGATAEGLGAGLLDVPDAEGLRALLALPGDVIPLGLVTIGHPEREQPAGSARRGPRPVDEVVHAERWGRGWNPGARD